LIWVSGEAETSSKTIATKAAANTLAIGGRNMAGVNEVGCRMALILAFGMLSSFAAGATAFAQAGSTGGTIGKQDKSISGSAEEDRPRAVSHPKRPRLKPFNVRGSSSQSDLTKPGALPGEPPYGEIPPGQRIFVQSAACPKGKVMEVTGGLKSLNIPRRRRCIATN
jgi:hypothetical protein